MKIISRSVKQTINIGKQLAKRLKPGDIICLYGDLGSGKTVLTKGIAEGLGINQDKIISPTFVLIRSNPAKDKLTLHHFDLYRLKGCGDILALGLEEYFYSDGISVIEWADRLGKLAPKEYLKVALSVKGDKIRWLEFKASGKRHQELLEHWK